MERGAVEERSSRNLLVGDGVSLAESLDIRPILLERLLVGRRRHQPHAARQSLRQKLVDVRLLAGRAGAVRQRDPHRRQRFSEPRRLDEFAVEIEHRRPLPGILGADDLAVFRVDQGQGPVPQQATRRHPSRVQFFALHRLDRIPSYGDDRAEREGG